MNLPACKKPSCNILARRESAHTLASSFPKRFVANAMLPCVLPVSKLAAALSASAKLRESVAFYYIAGEYSFCARQVVEEICGDLEFLVGGRVSRCKVFGNMTRCSRLARYNLIGRFYRRRGGVEHIAKPTLTGNKSSFCVQSAVPMQSQCITPL